MDKLISLYVFPDDATTTHPFPARPYSHISVTLLSITFDCERTPKDNIGERDIIVNQNVL